MTITETGSPVDSTGSALQAGGLLTLEEFAVLVRAPIATVRHWRRTGYGPQGFRVGRRVMYDATEVAEFVDRCRAADGAA